jgi:hypothetical protein
MIEQLWTVNIWNEIAPIDDKAHDELHRIALNHVDKFNGVPEIFGYTKQIPNLFEEEEVVIQSFKSLIRDRMNVMLSYEGFIDPENVELEVTAFPRRFFKGDRAKPHTHRSVDYVAVYYLDLDVEDNGDTSDHDDGRFILIDPISQRSRGLNHSMCKQLQPQRKSLIIHPSYLFHETEMYKGDKPRDMIVMNIRVLDRQQSGAFTTL